jgi:hypothetical protein
MHVALHRRHDNVNRDYKMWMTSGYIGHEVNKWHGSRAGARLPGAIESR